MEQRISGDGLLTGLIWGSLATHAIESFPSLPKNDLERIAREFQEAISGQNFPRAIELYPALKPLMLTEYFKKALKDFDVQSLELLLAKLDASSTIEGKSLLRHLIEKTVEYERGLKGVIKIEEHVIVALIALAIGAVVYLLPIAEVIPGGNVLLPAVTVIIFYLIGQGLIYFYNLRGKNEEAVRSMVTFIRKIMAGYVEAEKYLDEATRNYFADLLLYPNASSAVAQLLESSEYNDLLEMNIILNREK